MILDGWQQTLLGDMLDKAVELDRAAGRDPQTNDSALSMACGVYTQLHHEAGVNADTAAALAAIASGVANPWIGADGRLID